MDLDPIDARLLRALAENGRRSWTDLARSVDLTPPAVADRVRRLEREGVIIKYTTALSPEALGLPVLAFVTIGTDNAAAHEELLAWTARSGNVLECHAITGGEDYLLKVRACSTEELERMVREELRSIPGIVQTNAQVVLATVKETTKLPVTTTISEK